MTTLFHQAAAPVVEKNLQAPVSDDIRLAAPAMCPANAIRMVFEGCIARMDEFDFPRGDTLSTGWNPYMLSNDKIVLPKLFDVNEESGTITNSVGYHLGVFTSFDPVAANRANKGGRYYNVEELEYALSYLAENPPVYMGLALALEALASFADAGYTVVEKTPVTSAMLAAADPLQESFRVMESNAMPSDLYLRALALPVHDRALNPDATFTTPLVAENIPISLQWFYDVNARSLEGRCPFSTHLRLILSMPLFKGTPREINCLAGFINASEKMVQGSERWKNVADQIAAHFDKQASHMKFFYGRPDARQSKAVAKAVTAG